MGKKKPRQGGRTLFDANTRPVNQVKPVTPVPDPTMTFVCEICGSGMYESHCKIICNNCGYIRDCSDP